SLWSDTPQYAWRHERPGGVLQADGQAYRIDRPARNAAGACQINEWLRSFLASADFCRHLARGWVPGPGRSLVPGGARPLPEAGRLLPCAARHNGFTRFPGPEPLFATAV